MTKIKKTWFFQGGLLVLCGAILAGCNDDTGEVNADPAPEEPLITSPQVDLKNDVLSFSSASHLVGENIAIKAIKTDLQGNKLLAGSFMGAMDFGSRQQPDVRDAGETDDAFVVELNSQGDVVWDWSVTSEENVNAVFNSKDYARIGGLTVDSEGGIYVIGDFSGSMDFDPGIGVDIHATSTAGLSDLVNIFITKLSAEGNYLWTKSYHGDGWDYGFGITSDSSDNIYITGSFTSSYLNFGLDASGDLVRTEKLSGISPAREGADVFVSKLSKNGVEIWTQNYGAKTSRNNSKVYGYSAGHSILLNEAESKVVVSGSLAEIIDFTPQDGEATGRHYTDGGAIENLFVAQLDASMGVYEWSYQIDAWSDDIKQSAWNGTEYAGSWLATNSDGEVFVASYFKGDAIFDFNATSSTLSADASPVVTNDMFVTKLSALGLHEWTNVMGADGDDRIEGIASDAQGDVYLTGRYANAVDFDASIEEDVLTAVGINDAFITKVASDGRYVWTRTFESVAAAIALGRTLVIDGDRLISVGNLSSTADFEPGSGEEFRGVAGTNSVYISEVILSAP